jgi:hypothetical protein
MSFDWATVGSALVGTIVGSILSTTSAYFLQRRQFNEAKRQRDADRLEIRKALGYSVLFKAIHITSSFYNINNHFEESFRNTSHPDMASWEVLVPFANLPERVTFTPEEKGLLISLGDIELFNELVAFDGVHNSLLDVASTYAKLRRSVTEMLSAEIGESGIGTSSISNELRLKIQPRAYEMDQLVSEMRKWASTDARKSREVLAKLHGVLKKEFGLSNVLEFIDEPSTGAKERQ